MSNWQCSLIALAATLTSSAGWAAMPDVVCHLEREAQVEPITFEMKLSAPRQTYRFKNGELFISGPDRSEYLYGKLVEVEPGRFTVGHKTLLYGDIVAGRDRLLMFHADRLDMRITQFVCSR